MALVLGVILLVRGAVSSLFQPARRFSGSAAQPSPAFGGPATIGEVLFSQYLLPFEVTSILLLVAMIGAIVLTRRSA